MKKGLLLGALLVVYTLLTIYFVQSPPTADSGASSVDRNEQEHQPSRPIYPELEVGIPNPDRRNEKALKKIERRMAYPPGDWDWEVIRTDPLDHGRPGPPLLRDYERGRGRGAPHRQRR